MEADDGPSKGAASRLLEEADDPDELGWEENGQQSDQETSSSVTVGFDGIEVLCFAHSFPADGKWEFHVGDADPFPSVPHGHKVNDRRLKLDAYLGFTYKSGKQIHRLGRSSIVELWNNQSFRDFAHKAIAHFIAGHPAYTFRVTNPLKLPLKRP